jgi:hypothetical protein
VIATGAANNETQSYAIFLYSEIEWLGDYAVIGVLDGHSLPLFAFRLTRSIIKRLVQAFPSGVLVADLNKYYQESATTQDAMPGHDDTSKLALYSAELRKPLEILQRSIDLI